MKREGIIYQGEMQIIVTENVYNMVLVATYEHVERSLHEKDNMKTYCKF